MNLEAGTARILEKRVLRDTSSLGEKQRLCQRKLVKRSFIIFTFSHCYWDDELRRAERYARMGQNRTAYTN
jgi:hypothetical protein